MKIPRIFDAREGDPIVARAPEIEEKAQEYETTPEMIDSMAQEIRDDREMFEQLGVNHQGYYSKLRKLRHRDSGEERVVAAYLDKGVDEIKMMDYGNTQDPVAEAKARTFTQRQYADDEA